jgi:CRISPR-associated protein (TIGR03984 family)
MSDAEHQVTRQSCSPQEAVVLAAAGLKGTTAFAFISARSRFEIGSLEGGTIMVMRGDESGMFAPVAFADFEAAYELRLFGEAGDWHWRRDGLVGNLTVLMSAGNAETDIPRSYLMWGQSKPSVKYGKTGWTLMRDPRIKPFWAPVAAKSGAHLQLHAVEHVGRGIDGNAYVAFERLTSILADGGSNANGQ